MKIGGMAKMAAGWREIVAAGAENQRRQQQYQQRLPCSATIILLS